MTILHRYLAKTVIASILLIMCIVTALSFFISLLTEFRDIGLRDYSFFEAIIHCLLRLPYNIYQFSPMVVLIGGIFGLGLLATNQELMVMRTSGVSFSKLIQAIISGAFIIILTLTIVGEVVSPKANYLADKRKVSVQNGGQAIATSSGVWVHEGNDFFHVEQVSGKYHLEGVTRYQFDPHHNLLATYYASSMDFIDGRWMLFNLAKTTFDKDSVRSQQFSQATWNMTLNPNLLTIGLIEPEEMSLRKLFTYSEHLSKNGLQATEFKFSFWKRVFQPLATIVMILLALPFVLNISRSTMIGWRISIGVIVGFTFYIINTFLGQLSIVLQFSPWFAALLPIFIFASLGYAAGIKLSR